MAERGMADELIGEQLENLRCYRKAQLLDLNPYIQASAPTPLADVPYEEDQDKEAHLQMAHM